MSKQYNFDLDMTTDNSLSAILRNIKPNSRVLEIGSSYGRATKYLKESLNCLVDIVELSEEAGKSASQYSNLSFIGKEKGNIEWSDNCCGNFFDNNLINREYDYIIFADILEHLNNPEKILNLSKEYLSSNGSIWISIPNVAYNGVIINLLMDQFPYSETGLLDKTHIKFFTSNSLEKMVKDCQLKIKHKFDLRNMLHCSEFKVKYSDLPSMISTYLKSRKTGEVYQFVWELIK